MFSFEYKLSPFILIESDNDYGKIATDLFMHRNIWRQPSVDNDYIYVKIIFQMNFISLKLKNKSIPVGY